MISNYARWPIPTLSEVFAATCEPKQKCGGEHVPATQEIAAARDPRGPQEKKQ